MNPGPSDDLVMLLSTDWFLPYWFVLGIGAEDERKVCVKEGCRKIVKQIMSGAREYWHVSFSEERISETHFNAEVCLRKVSSK